MVEQCSEGAELNSRVTSSAVFKALPTLKSFGILSWAALGSSGGCSAFPFPHRAVTTFSGLPRIPATRLLHPASHRLSSTPAPYLGRPRHSCATLQSDVALQAAAELPAGLELQPARLSSRPP